jgi:hypothetical protein
MTTAEDLARAKASVQACEPIPIRRYGQVPPIAAPAGAQVPERSSRLKSALATGCWLLMMAFAVGMVVRFGH